MSAIDEKPLSTSLVEPAGPLSEVVLAMLAEPAAGSSRLWAAGTLSEFSGAVAEPLENRDLQLALYLCYELHYRGFPGIDPEWEWNPDLIAARAVLEDRFGAALARAVPPLPAVDPERVGDRLFQLEAEDEGPSLSRYVETSADLDQFREFVVQRSLYQLKEADPHSWAIPRLRGPAKTALLEVQHDEYGGGRAERMHSTLFAKTMRALGLDDAENAYLDQIPGPTLAAVNLLSFFGLRRRWRGALVGHLAMFEMTSARPNRRYGNGLRRLGFDREATDFYDEHVEADAVHENIAAYDLAGGLARAEPELAADVIFGARALLELEDRFARHLLSAWEAGEISLRSPLPGV
ncbi:MAG: hypothetical protein QOE75_1838 [Solirubrobacterales bacterium]|jgi:hypothetical protein|nr:hypothetical protein [Solirubrobacterales bacterium]